MAPSRRESKRVIDENPWAVEERAAFESTTAPRTADGQAGCLTGWRAAQRIVWFFAITALVLLLVNSIITSGLRRLKTSEYGLTNRMLRGDINADIVITGSSRAASHYDPRVIRAVTGRSTVNLGRNGSQTDMQVAVFKTYLEHNRKPDLVIQNLDGFTFVTTREVYDMAQYIPYLNDKELYDPLRTIDRDVWRSRYVPLYGYVVDDMNFAWTLGLRGFFGWSPKEDHFLGFDPRAGTWTDDFERFKATNPEGVRWDIEPAGVQIFEGLLKLCRQQGIRLILVYSPEYAEMQQLTRNRAEIFTLFHTLAEKYGDPVWDYSGWEHAGDTRYFANSQHLNARGADLFSRDLAVHLKSYLRSEDAILTADRN